MTTTSDARKRLAASDVPRLFVATDGYDIYVWANDPDHPDLPQPVLSERDVKDPALWAWICAGIESGGVQ